MERVFWGEKEWQKESQEKELGKDAASEGDELASDFIGSRMSTASSGLVTRSRSF